MNLKDRLKIRALINLVLSIIERLVNIFVKIAPKPKVDIPPNTIKPNRRRPLKKVIDNIPLPWRK